MDETPQTSKQNILEQRNKDLDNSKNKIKNSDFFKCLINCYSSFRNKSKKCQSNCSIMNQFLFHLLPLSFIITFGLILIHLYLFDGIFKFDYYTLIKQEFLRYLITDIDDAHFELSSNEIKSTFEDIGNIVFFKIYFGELISLGLLDGERIFPNISNVTEEFYSFVDFLISNKSNSLFHISSDIAKKYVDERNDSLAELIKVYYYIYPLISYEAYSIQTYINQTFLIAYEMDDDKNIIGNELYFNFPKINDFFIKNNNFHRYNNFISPKINRSKPEYSNLINNSFYLENWFINQDYIYRSIASEESDLICDFFHLNINHEGNINKTTVYTMQTFYKNNKGKKFIINIIYFVNQQKLEINPFDHSVFIVNNNSDFKTKKFSDNQTFVISQNDISEITLSSLISQYFHYGLYSNNYNFYGKGIFYDNIDLNLLSEPTEYYSTIKGFNFDVRYFSPFYLYTKLFQKSSFVKNFSESENIYKFYFNESWHISDICSKFNFSLYKNYLTSHNINCFNKKNLLYYYKEKEHSSIADDITLPYCICLPLYCIKDIQKDFDTNNIEFVDDITLPEKCQNNLEFYENDITEKNLIKDNEIELSDFQLRKGENLNEQLEEQFIKIAYEKYQLFGGLSFILISIVDNTSLKVILTNLISNLNKMRNIFICIVSIGFSLLAIVVCVLIIIHIYKMSKLIYEFKEKLFKFIFQIHLTASNKKDDLNINKNNDFIFNDKNNLEFFPLLENEYLDNKVINNFDNDLNNKENKLIDDLFLLYCKFYRISDEKMQKYNEDNKKLSKSKMKINALVNNNELFKLFCIISMYIPKFKLNISIDFDFYKESKLMNNFLKCISKKSSNIDKEQILYSKSILYELLSTELINDYGFITNLNFKYLTNITLGSNKKINPIQKAIFKQVEEFEKKDRRRKDKILTDDDDNPNIKLVWKNKNLIMRSIEEKFEQDDYLQLNKLESSFNTSLINAFYNYTNKIIMLKDSES